jgi:hypothetical protein
MAMTQAQLIGMREMHEAMKTNKESKVEQTKHTPGPWQVESWGSRFVVVASNIQPDRDDLPGFEIATVRTGIPRQTGPNGRLIAAAPELLSALHECKWLLEKLVAMDRLPANNKALLDTLYAIAKAEGR